MSDRIRIITAAPGFAPVPAGLFLDARITDPSTIAVYAALSSFADYGGAACYPSLQAIGERARCSRDAVRRHLKLLTDLGYTEMDVQGAPRGVNLFRLIDPWGRRCGMTDGGGTGAMGGGTDATPHSMDARGGVAPVQGGGGTGATRTRLINEIKEREGETRASAPDPAREPSPAAEAQAAAPPSLSILEQIKKEAVSSGRGTAWMVNGWAARFERLTREVREVDILPAFRACLAAGGNPFYFPADFAKWAGKATTTTVIEAAPTPPPRDAPARCPDCGQPMAVCEDGYLCLPCHERFDRNLKREKIGATEEVPAAQETQ